jgi:hypothetical protein
MSWPQRVAAQTKLNYPDSLKNIAIKIEPLSFLYNHITAGVEVPLKNNAFLDVNVGIPNIGLGNHRISSGGFLFRGGVKFPFRSSSPFSLIYLMPEFIYNRYQSTEYYFPGSQSVTSSALLLCFGYRHVNPSTRFCYDIGVGLGYGWADNSDATNQIDFILLASAYNPYQTTSRSAAALSCHFSIGYILKKRK